MSKVRAAGWAVVIGVGALVMAGSIFALLPALGGVFAGLLLVSPALVAALASALVELPAAVGAIGGGLTALLFLIVGIFSVVSWPRAPGAHKPGWHDFLGWPMLIGLAVVAALALSGFVGARLGRRLARRPAKQP
jgi:hypothetical protein